MSFHPPSLLRKALFFGLHPGTPAGHPAPADAGLRARIGAEFRDSMRTYELSAEKFGNFKRDCGYAENYVSYMGAEMLNEKLIEHYVSLELLKIGADDVLLDIGSAQSPFADYAAMRFGCRSYQLDLAYTEGVHGNRIGASADKIPLEAGSVSALTLHCTIDHFEGNADSGFIREAARILRPDGALCVLPVYFASGATNVCDLLHFSPRERFDPEARLRCVANYNNRFGRYYSIETFRRRILEATDNLQATLYEIGGDREKIPNTYLLYALVMRKPK